MTTKTPPRPTLNPIAEYFGLQRMPFGRNLPVADLLDLPGQGEMNARLHQAVREQGIALVTGRGGCGKSTALRRFAESLDPNAFKVLYVPNPGPGLTGIYRDLLSAVVNHLPDKIDRTPWRRVERQESDCPGLSDT